MKSNESEALVVTPEALQTEIAPVVARAQSLVIVTAQDYEGAANFLKDIKAAAKKVDAFFDPVIEPARNTHKAALAQKAVFADPLKAAETTCKQKQLAWTAEQERKRQAEQSRLQAAADEAARRERERLEKEAAKLKTPELKAARLEQAAAVVAPVVQVASIAPEIKGQSVRKTWKAEVVDPPSVPRGWLIVNQQALDAFARSTKGAVRVPGVEFYEETTLASASK
jgi:hypothetical protein